MSLRVVRDLSFSGSFRTSNFVCGENSRTYRTIHWVVSTGELDAARVPERACEGHNSDEPTSTSNDHTPIPFARTHKSWNARKREMKESGAYASRAAARKEARRLRTVSKETAEGESPCKKGFIARSFDRVLLDAPCSALGIRPRLFAGVVWSLPHMWS